MIIFFSDKKSLVFEIKDVNKLTLEIKKQIYSFSLMTQSLLSVVNSNNDILKSIFLIFDSTDLYMAFPFNYHNSWNFLDIFDNFTDNPSWCTDEEGNIITYHIQIFIYLE